MKSTRSSVTGFGVVALRSQRPPAPVSEDADAQRVLAWLKRGKPGKEVVFDDAVPAQSEADLAKFRATSYRHTRSR